jgi:hypothetical protein
MQAIVDGLLDREGAFGLFVLDGDGNEPTQELIRQRAVELLETERYMHSGTTDPLVQF